MTQGELAVQVGQLLRTRRESRGLSQARLAERARISQQRLSMLERGRGDPRLGDLQRLFAGLGLRLRLEAEPAGVAEDPDLLLSATPQELAGQLVGYDYLLDKLHDLPHLVGGRLAAVAHGLPVRVQRLDLLVADAQRPQFNEAIRRFSSVRWSERLQEFCDYQPPERPGPMRWRIGVGWELCATLLASLPEPVVVELRGRRLPVPPLPWLLAHDLDVAGLRNRLTAAGWQPGLPAAAPAPA